MGKREEAQAATWRPVAYEEEFGHLDERLAEPGPEDTPALELRQAQLPIQRSEPGPGRSGPPKAWVPGQAANGAEVAQRVIATVMQSRTSTSSASGLDGVFTPVAGAHDATSAKDRAAALNIKMLWQVGMLGGVALAILLVCLAVGAWVDRPGAGFFVGAVAGLVLIFTVGSERLNQMIADDNEYSREGTERHRIDRAVDVQLARMEHEAELKKMALGAVLKQLGVRDDD